MGVLEAFGLSLVGFSIVFIVLVFLMAVIKVLAKIFSVRQVTALPAEPALTAAPAIPVASAKQEPEPALTVTPATPAVSAKQAPKSTGDVCLFDVPDKEAALIMAIVADKLKTPLNELQFKSIREVKGE